MALLFCIFVTPPVYAENEIGKVVHVQGTAYIHRKDVAAPIAASVGAPVQLHDRITTDADSRLRIRLNDDSMISLGESGDLNLDNYEYDPDQKKRSALFGVKMGKVRVFANELSEFKQKDFRIQTPTAVCGVRGTLFLVWVQSSTITRVVAFDNPVQVANILKPNEFVVLTKNLISDIRGGNAPTKPILATPAMLKELEKGLDELKIEPSPDKKTEDKTTTETTTTEATTTEATTTEATTTAATTTAETTTQATTTQPTTTQATTTQATTTTTTSPTTTTSTTRPTTTTSTTTTTTRPTTTTTSTTSSTTSTTTTSTTTTSTSSTTSTTLPKLPSPPLPGRI
jgi:hypothetical protein